MLDVVGGGRSAACPRDQSRPRRCQGAHRSSRDDDLEPSGRIELGDDADNIRVDAKANKIYVGYGNGALAIVDPVKALKIRDIRLDAHPESFQLDAGGATIFVNVPKARQIAVVDVAAGKVRTKISPRDVRSNYPMAIDYDKQRVLTVFRNPPKLITMNSRDGSAMISMDVCGDSDDVFVDQKRYRVYVSCGEGFIDVFDAVESGYVRSGHIRTVSGARTSLWVPELDRLFVAVRANGAEPAAIWVFRPEQ